MQVKLDHPKGTIKNKVTVYLNDLDCDNIKKMNDGAAMMVCLGYELLVVVRRETDNERENSTD